MYLYTYVWMLTLTFDYDRQPSLTRFSNDERLLSAFEVISLRALYTYILLVPCMYVSIYVDKTTRSVFSARNLHNSLHTLHGCLSLCALSLACCSLLNDSGVWCRTAWGCVGCLTGLAHEWTDWLGGFVDWLALMQSSICGTAAAFEWLTSFDLNICRGWCTRMCVCTYVNIFTMLTIEYICMHMFVCTLNTYMYMYMHVMQIHICLSMFWRVFHQSLLRFRSCTEETSTYLCVFWHMYVCVYIHRCAKFPTLQVRQATTAVSTYCQYFSCYCCCIYCCHQRFAFLSFRFTYENFIFFLPKLSFVYVIF